MDLGVVNGRDLVAVPDPTRGGGDQASEGLSDAVLVPGAVLGEGFQGFPGGGLLQGQDRLGDRVFLDVRSPSAVIHSAKRWKPRQVKAQAKVFSKACQMDQVSLASGHDASPVSGQLGLSPPGRFRPGDATFRIRYTRSVVVRFFVETTAWGLSGAGYYGAISYQLGVELSGQNLNNYSLIPTSIPAPPLGPEYNVTLTIDPAPLIGHFTVMPAPGLTVAGKTYDGTTAVGPINTSLTGVLPGDSVNFMMWGAQFASANAGTWTVAPGTVSGSNLVSGEHEYILSGWDAQNYSLQSIASTTATITPANATITVMPYFVTYDDTFHYVTSAVTGVSVVSYPGNAVPPMPVWNVQQLPSSDLIIHSTPEITRWDLYR